MSIHASQFLFNTLFSIPRSLRGYCTLFCHHVSLSSSWLLQFLRLSLCLVTLTVLGNSCSGVLQNMPQFEVSIFSFLFRLSLLIWRRKTTEINGTFTPSYQGCVLVHDVTVDADLDHLVEVMFVCFIHYKFIFTPFLIFYFGTKQHVQHTLKELEIMFPFLPK